MTDESKCPNCGDECWEARGDGGCFERVPNQLVALTFQIEDENGRAVVERWSDMIELNPAEAAMEAVKFQMELAARDFLRTRELEKAWKRSKSTDDYPF